MSFVVKAEQDILTPSTDDRKYRYVVLENELKVLLISDPTTDKCAACCSVQVGSMSDPPEAQGLAHFLEHMLFMGTDKYPEENEYSAYLNSHGGYSNAYTDVENTVYYFDVQNDHFEGALDRFAAFFSCPLFAESSTDREIQAVDSENSKNLQSDMWRIYQLFKNFARPDHPLNSFSTGNKVTLGDVPKAAGTNIRDLMIAFYRKYYSANLMNVTIYGHDSLDQLQNWAVEKFSSVPNQHIERESFPTDPFRREQLSQFVEITPVRDMRYVEFFFPMPSVEYLYRSKPHKVLAHLIGHESDGSILAALKKKMWANSLSASPYRSNKDFACFGVSISLTEQGLEHVHEVIAAVFAYAGMLVRQGIPDWVWQELKETGDMQFRFQEKKEPSDYAVELAAAMDIYAPKEVIAGHRVFFEKDVATTTALAQCLQPENALIFLYHKGTAGKTTQKEQWYGTPYSARSFTAEETALWQQSYAGGSHWDSLVSLPQPNPFVPTDFSLKGTLNEGSSDKVAFVPPKLIDSVRQRGALQEVLELQAQLEEQRLTAQLEDVTLSVAPKNESASPQTSEQEGEGGEEEEEEENADGECGEVDPDDADPSGVSPKNWNQVVAGDELLLWHRLDAQWQMPKVCTVFALESNFGSASPWNVVMIDLLSKVLSELLNEFAYYADCAGLYFDISLTKGGLQIRIQGYGHKLPVLVERVFQELQNFATTSATTYDIGLFQRVKDCMVRSYKNQLFSQPYYHSMLATHQCLEEPRWGIFEKLHALELVNPTSLQAFAQQFLSQIRIEAFMNGNITSDEAKDLLRKVHDILKTSHLPYALQPLRRAVALTAGYDYLYRQCAQVYNPNEVNSASSIFYLFGEIAGCPPSIMDVASNESLQAALTLEAYRNLFVRMMSEPAFDQLRTKEQLGYMVYVARRDLAERQMSIAIIVQSSVQDPVYLDSRIDAFLSQYRREVLGTMDEATLQTFITAEIEALLEKPKNLDEETRRYWDEISKGLYLFDRDQHLVQILQTPGLFTVASMQSCFDRYFGTSSPARTSFSSQFFGKGRRLPRVPEISVHTSPLSGALNHSNHSHHDQTETATEGAVSDAAIQRRYVVVRDPMEFKRTLPLLPARNYLAPTI